MINHFVEHSTIYSLVISFIALIVSIYSVWYTKLQNRHNIEIEFVDLDVYDSHPLINFHLLNDSNSSIKIENLTVSSDVDVLLDYEPVGSDPYIPGFVPPHYRSSNFEVPYTISPNESSTYTYYFNGAPSEIKITVETNQRIDRWRTYKIWSFQFDQPYQYYDVQD
ncbi:hypothetical protein FE331_00390 [Dolosigranulum pigrum]|uniref:hypothetical protein n=1 Tax=Dolosigranulum pigrum TaxID=29394 RepID=UPI001AD87418|nr:hypothetical protein [Dolosigranulum pigrum]QTJ49178.1 hypothetical protein FE331_00390 [Dolosigranulum pigrum]